MHPSQNSRRLRTPEAAAYIGLAVPTLEKDRCNGTLGVPYLKIGKAVRYDTAQLDDWLARHRRLNTSQSPRPNSRAPEAA